MNKAQIIFLLLLAHTMSYTMNFEKYLTLAAKYDILKDKHPELLKETSIDKIKEPIQITLEDKSTVSIIPPISTIPVCIGQRLKENNMKRVDAERCVVYEYTSDKKILIKAICNLKEDYRYKATMEKDNKETKLTNSEQVFTILDHAFKNKTPREKIFLPNETN